VNYVDRAIHIPWEDEGVYSYGLCDIGTILARTDIQAHGTVKCEDHATANKNFIALLN
jgi:hypothetical protein